MKRFLCGLFLLVLVPFTAAAAHPLAGKWLGSVDSDKGEMQIGLKLDESDGKLSGVLQTAHGEWPVTHIKTEKDIYTLTFDTGNGDGTISGRVDGTRFSGAWKTPMAEGTFLLDRK